MLVESGKLDEALPLAKEDLAECRTHYGKEHQECVQALPVKPLSMLSNAAIVSAIGRPQP